MKTSDFATWVLDHRGCNWVADEITRGTDWVLINEGLFIWGCDIVGDIGYEHPTIGLAYLTHLARYQVPSISPQKSVLRCRTASHLNAVDWENNGSREFSRKPVHWQDFLSSKTGYHIHSNIFPFNLQLDAHPQTHPFWAKKNPRRSNDIGCE